MYIYTDVYIYIKTKYTYIYILIYIWESLLIANPSAWNGHSASLGVDAWVEDTWHGQPGKEFVKRIRPHGDRDPGRALLARFEASSLRVPKGLSFKKGILFARCLVAKILVKDERPLLNACLRNKLRVRFVFSGDPNKNLVSNGQATATYVGIQRQKKTETVCACGKSRCFKVPSHVGSRQLQKGRTFWAERV